MVVTTLTRTLLVLGGLGVTVALELIGLVLNMFCTSNFFRHFLDLCSMLEQLYKDNEHVFFLI
jgi:hypothetical protein